ncbi:MAG: hypothetical protein E1N59_1290 [Puniceicoccaceae bacterium 5H]|nr:MAG: hypothetical protein E1N59_1290 [Puniceicoccaceae bacterium 5H]
MLPTQKRQYLDRIRQESAYPTFRSIITLVLYLGYAAAALAALVAVFGGIGTMFHNFGSGLGMFVGGLLYAAFLFIMARFWKEAAIIIADIGDSLLDKHAAEATLAAGKASNPPTTPPEPDV